jgi:hypothetical protein
MRRFRRIGPTHLVAFDMLAERSSRVRHVKQLQPAADGKHRRVTLERFVQQDYFHRVPSFVWNLGTGIGGLTVEFRIKVRTAAQEKSVKSFERTNGVRGGD